MLNSAAQRLIEGKVSRKAPTSLVVSLLTQSPHCLVGDTVSDPLGMSPDPEQSYEEAPDLKISQPSLHISHTSTLTHTNTNTHPHPQPHILCTYAHYSLVGQFLVIYTAFINISCAGSL